jgi:hypothetical protein
MSEQYAVSQLSSDALVNQHEAPSCFGNIFCRFLNECFNNKCGFLVLPRGSPHLTPPDFFVWRYVKNIVFHEVISDLRYLQHRIREITAVVTEVMFVNTRSEIKYCFDVYRCSHCNLLGDSNNFWHLSYWICDHFLCTRIFFLFLTSLKYSVL